ncbi:MAG: hypothetical protein RLZZ262_1757 [Bacteroidota bacterium]
MSCNFGDESRWHDFTESLFEAAQMEDYVVYASFVRLDKGESGFISLWWDDTLMFKDKSLAEVKKYQKKWIKKEGCEAYFDTIRSLLDPAMMAIHRKAWQIPEVNERRSAEPGVHMVVTSISKDNRPGWYLVEVRRSYPDGGLRASWPMPFVLVHESNDSVIVRDPILGDLPIEEWRRLEE